MPQIITKRNKAHLDTMIIGQGHTIMAGHIPPSIGPQNFSENFYKWANTTNESMEQFGFWGGEIDYNTYYPNLNAEELKPKDEEFIEPMFRLLSATIVSKNYNPTDFGQPGILKASMKMLLGQTVNCDHETNIGNAIGAVSAVSWQEEYKVGSFTIPAGINGVLKIDGKANPRIARGILMDPPSIHSNSVTVQFKWDKSHPDMGDDEFYQKLGTYDSKGEMIRRMVTEVVRYTETSLVSHGADSFAQKIGADGKIVNPEYAKRVWNSYSEYQEDTHKQYFFSDFKTDILEFEESNDTQSYNNDNQETQISNNMNKELEAFLQRIFGDGLLSLREGQEMNEENVIDCIRSLVESNTTMTNTNNTLSSEKSSLTEQVTNLQSEVASLKAMAIIGTNYVASLRETVVANYKKLKGDNVDESIVTMLNAETTALATLTSLNKEYETQLNEKFPLTCSKCGSHDVSRASSVKEQEDTTKNEEVKSTTDVFNHIYQEKFK